MEELGGLAYLRPATPEDDAFLYDVFATTWAEEAAALPNQALAAHVLRIQHTSQERRFAARYPGHERLVILHAGRRAGRLYLHLTPSTVHAIDMTLLPEYRSHGLGSQIIGDLLTMAARNGQAVTARVPRRNTRANSLYESLGFRLSSMDDLDNYLEWNPQRGRHVREDPPFNPGIAEG